VVDREPVSGVRTRVRVYGKVEIGVPWFEVVVVLDVDDDDDDGISVAAGRVLNRNPVDMPMSEETGE
jgi:hypothetical protein